MKSSNPKISVAIPIHQEMLHFEYFFDRVIRSIEKQSFKDYEIVVTDEGLMPVNTNAAIRKSKGELIKILYMDDYLAHPDSLKNIVEAFDRNDDWLVTGCLHQHSTPESLEEPHSPHFATYSEDIHTGHNTIGSPSVLTIRNEGRLLFDERLSFLLDCDLYRRYKDRYGLPKVINDLNVVIGIHSGQTSNIMPDKEKEKEFKYMKQKYA